MKIIIVGGFLGAGKTTLLSAAATELIKRGLNVAMVTNDQAPDLVDTQILTTVGSPIEEIAGSCFCCNFNGFASALSTLASKGAEVVLAEPVGSCTDLASTIIRPLKKLYPDWEIAPLSVLIDSERLLEVSGSASTLMDPDSLYIYEKQLEEADRCLISKSDLLHDDSRRSLIARFTDVPTHFVSSTSGEGINDWLDAVLASTESGMRKIEVDYDRYAHGEAVLGWLNATYDLPSQASGAVVPNVVGALAERASEQGMAIGHIKASAAIAGHLFSANVTTLGGSLQAHSSLTELSNSRLTINARVQTSPEELSALVEATVRAVCGEVTLAACRTLRSLSPGRPVPTHRM